MCVCMCLSCNDEYVQALFSKLFVSAIQLHMFAWGPHRFGDVICPCAKWHPRNFSPPPVIIMLGFCVKQISGMSLQHFLLKVP